jgi:hypothetical protein
MWQVLKPIQQVSETCFERTPAPQSAADRHVLPAAIDIAPTVLGFIAVWEASVFGIASQKLVVENDTQK